MTTVVTNMNSKDIAVKALEVMKSKNLGWWWPTIPLMESVGTDNRSRFRRVMDRLRDLGIVDKKGVGKFRWKLLRTDYDPVNPFKTPPKEEEKKSSPLAGITAEPDETGKLWWLHGETYPHRERLKALGCRWNETRRLWWIESSTETLGARLALQDLGVKFLKNDDKFLKNDNPPPAPSPKPIEATPPQVLLDKIEVLEKELKDLKQTQKVEITLIKPDKTKVEIKDRVHPLFETVMFHINCGDNVMLVGPKGCGKTYLAEQVAKALKVDYGMLSLSGGVTESKLFGRVTPNITTGKSEYHPGPFAEQFEGGGLFLLDEVDAADPNVLLSINSALANGVLALDRPKNPLARRHKDFVCMAAANTWGNGADRQYVGRNQQDSAFTERFVQIEMDYDAGLERSLCPGATELVDRMHKYRERLVAARLERTISTRFIVRAFNWLQHGKDLDYVEKMLFAGWRADEIRKVKGF